MRIRRSLFRYLCTAFSSLLPSLPLFLFVFLFYKKKEKRKVGEPRIEWNPCREVWCVRVSTWHGDIVSNMSRVYYLWHTMSRAPPFQRIDVCTHSLNRRRMDVRRMDSGHAIGYRNIRHWYSFFFEWMEKGGKDDPPFLSNFIIITSAVFTNIKKN